MINSTIAKQLVNKLGLAVGRMSMDDIMILRYKWSGVDGLFHSFKHMVNKQNFKKTKDELVAIENMAVGVIDEALDGIFTCQNCDTDVRKCGLFKIETCLRRHNIFISSEGNVTRTTSESYSNKIFRDHKPVVYVCGNCEGPLDNHSPMLIFLLGGINNDSIWGFIDKFHPEHREELSQYFNGYSNKKRYQDEYPMAEDMFDAPPEMFVNPREYLNVNGFSGGSGGLSAVSPPPVVRVSTRSSNEPF